MDKSWLHRLAKQQHQLQELVPLNVLMEVSARTAHAIARAPSAELSVKPVSYLKLISWLTL